MNLYAQAFTVAFVVGLTAAFSAAADVAVILIRRPVQNLTAVLCDMPKVTINGADQS